jgi:hypothetical protein
MSMLYGVTPQYIATAGAMPTRAPNEPPRTLGSGTDTIVVDGTPVRVVVLALAAAAALTALRFGGIRFNVGVSS